MRIILTGDDLIDIAREFVKKRLVIPADAITDANAIVVDDNGVETHMNGLWPQVEVTVDDQMDVALEPIMTARPAKGTKPNA